MKISSEELEELWKNWLSNPNGKRFGEFVVNEKLEKGLSCPKLFFASTGCAIDILKDHISGKTEMYIIATGHVE